MMTDGSPSFGGLPDEAGELLDAFGRGPDGRSTGIPSGGGVPSWMAAMLNYCSRCGTELTFGPIEGEDRDRLGCPSCGHIAYVNPRLVVTTIPVTPPSWIGARYSTALPASDMSPMLLVPGSLNHRPCLPAAMPCG